MLKSRTRPGSDLQTSNTATIARLEAQRKELVFLRVRVQGNLAELRTEAGLPGRREQGKKTQLELKVLLKEQEKYEASLFFLFRYLLLLPPIGLTPSGA